MSNVITVKLWGTIVGYLGYAPNQTEITTFEYDKNFMLSQIQLSPLVMQYPPARHEFQNISQNTFHGLPGIFADSLPDKFGNQLIDLYFAEKGILQSEVTALDRLCYIGKRSMGAFEYEPSEPIKIAMDGGILDIEMLSELSDMVLSNKKEFARKLSNASTQKEMLSIVRIGSSAGGARSKALIAIDKEQRIYDGTIENGADKRYWLLKFDTSANSDKERHKDPKGMTRVEYVYSLMARECGIDIPETDYLIDGESFHYMIERFDRVIVNKKVQKAHYSSWAGLQHFDRDSTGVYSYEQLILCCRQLKLGQDEITELFRRAVFNIVGRNQDDHAKNFGFIMDRSGKWRLSPAFDMTYAYDPTGKWTRTHQISLNGKRDEFSRDDLITFAKRCNIKIAEAEGIIDKTVNVFLTFEHRAEKYNIPLGLKETITAALRCESLRGWG